MAELPFDRLFNSAKIVDYVTDKRLSAKSYMRYFLIRLMKMFKYSNLPDTIPKEMLEYYLMMNGTCFVTKVNDELYAFVGGTGGEPDVYYRPTVYTFANPALNKSYMAKIDTDAPPVSQLTYSEGKDGVLCRNDSLWLGLAPLLSRYATLMSENAVTVRVADIMLRAVSLITAPDDSTRIAAETYLRKLEKGELGVIGENRFFDGVRLQSPPSNNGSYLTQFIEYQQYLKGSFYNEIGLNANFNMKREAIGEGESSLNEDSLLPLCEDMLQCRQDDMRRISELFQLDPPITVDFDSAWKLNVEQMHSELEKKKGEGRLSQADADYRENEVENQEDAVSQLTDDAVEEDVVSQLTEEGGESSDDDVEVVESEDEDTND